MSIKIKASDGELLEADLIFRRSDGKSVIEYTGGALKGVRGMVEDAQIVGDERRETAKAGTLDAKLQSLANELTSFNVDHFDTAAEEGFNSEAQNALPGAMLKLINVINSTRRAAAQNRRTNFRDPALSQRQVSNKAFGERSLPNAKRALEELYDDLPSMAIEASNSDASKRPYVTKLDGQIEQIIGTINRLME